MARMKSLLALCVLVPVTTGACASARGVAPAATDRFDPPEIRALWVDAFHAGIRSRAETDELIATAARANLNTLFVQVRRRGDALYIKGEEPPLDDPAYDPTFDALAYVIDAAHRAGIEVHAWVNAMPAWREEAPPTDPRHVFNRHGPHAPGDENWFTASPAGDPRFQAASLIGHPAMPSISPHLREHRPQLQRGRDSFRLHPLSETNEVLPVERCRQQSRQPRVSGVRPCGYASRVTRRGSRRRQQVTNRATRSLGPGGQSADQDRRH
jgi:hypothetical protein